MHSSKTTLRWVLLVPAAVAAWFGVFLIGLVAYQATEHATCPAARMVSGQCVDPRVQSTLEIVIYIFAGISAVAVETAAAVTAPSHKALVTWLTFFFGSWVALVFGFAGNAYGQASTAIAAGLMGAVVIARSPMPRVVSAARGGPH